MVRTVPVGPCVSFFALPSSPSQRYVQITESRTEQVLLIKCLGVNRITPRLAETTSLSKRKPTCPLNHRRNRKSILTMFFEELLYSTRTYYFELHASPLRCGLLLRELYCVVVFIWQNYHSLFGTICRSMRREIEVRAEVEEKGSLPLPAGCENSNFSKPICILHRYMDEHSGQAIQLEYHLSSSSRKFAVAYYSCPMQAGNRLHHFLNSLLWGIVTNRTILWHYYDSEACWLSSDGKYDRGICRNANQESDCSLSILTLADWLPAFDYYAPLYNLPALSNRRHQHEKQNSNHTAVLHLDFWSTRVPNPDASSNSKFPWRPNMTGVDTLSDQIVEFPQMLGQDAKELAKSFKLDRLENQLLHTESARQRARALLSEGVDYLYGMLFAFSFSFGPAVAAPPGKELHTANRTNDEVFSIALHSRHTAYQDDGGNVQKELSCLDKLLQKYQKPNQTCIITAMSDRPLTLQRLSKESISRNCTVEIAQHLSRPSSWHKEHGPHAGIGYFVDLLTVPESEPSALIHRGRSSLTLIRESIVYRRKQDKAISNEEPLIECHLGNKKVTLNKS